MVFSGCVCITYDVCAVVRATVEVTHGTGESQILPPRQVKSSLSQTAVPWLEQQ